VLNRLEDKFTFLFSCMAIVMLFSFNAHAACSPGIPCTDYDIYTDTESGTDPALNGPKTGTPAPHTNETGATTSACDGNFMNQIYSHAIMGASREVIMSEQIIHKPDSVLEYTCFDQWVSVTAHHAGPIFSESTFWEDHEVCTSTGDSTASAGRPPSCASSGDNTVSPYDITIDVVFPDTHLDDALRTLLYDNIQTYVDNNFEHTFMGEATTIDNDIDTSGSTGSALGSGSYNCSHMSTVWNIAKCVDFGEDDRFRTFEDLVNTDPRSIPVECSPGFTASDVIEQGTNSTKLDSTSPGSSTSATSIMDPCPAAGTVAIPVEWPFRDPPSGSTAGTQFSNDLIRVANNCDDSANQNAYSSFDTATLYGELILGLHDLTGNYVPGTGGVSSGIVTTCSDPIPTGVPSITYVWEDYYTGPGDMLVADRDAYIYYEHICPNPGCFYRPVWTTYIDNAPIPATLPTGACLPY